MNNKDHLVGQLTSWAPTSSLRPFRHLNFVLRALRALRPCDPRTDGASGEILMPLLEKYKQRNESAFLSQTEEEEEELGILGS